MPGLVAFGLQGGCQFERPVEWSWDAQVADAGPVDADVPPDTMPGGAALAISQGAHDFTDVTVGNTSAELAVVVRNIGEQASGTISVALAGDNPGAFAIVSTGGADDCFGAVLDPQETCLAQVRFEPDSGGALSASLEVSAEPGGTVAVDVSGNGLTPGDLEITAGAALTFGAQEIQSMSSPQSITVRNNGDTATGNLTVTLGDTENYSKGNDTCNAAPLGPGLTCTVAVRFNPTTVGTAPTQVSIRESVTVGVSASAQGSGSARLGVSTTNTGTVTSSPPLLNCGATCGPVSFTQTPVTLTAQAGIGHEFGSWTGACATEPSSVCAVTLTQPLTTVGAVFDALPPPVVPVLRKPMNNAYVGTMTSVGSRRPTFTWEASAWTASGTVLYDLEYSADATFSTGVTTISTSATTYQPPADLTVSLLVPVGSRYFWRVRACVGTVCSARSSGWRVNVGRSGRDFNGDGFADVVVGAPDNDAGGSNAGRAYVYFGSAGTFDTTPDGTMTGAAGDGLGFSVASAGDVNGDGFADIIAGTGTGRVYLYRGGSGAFDTTADATIVGVAADSFGQSLATAGDVNGDGFGDVVVGAKSNGPGRALVYLGGSGAFDTLVDATLGGVAAGDEFGKAVASAGDVNGDGFADVVVGAWQNSTNGSVAGSAYVFSGSSGGVDANADAIILGAPSSGLGFSVCGADLNSDGFSDVAVSALDVAYAYLGGSGAFDGVSDATFSTGGGAIPNLADAGDVNGDGFVDIIASVPLLLSNGSAYVFFGGAGAPNTVADGTLTADGAIFFGQSVASAGDANGDGFADVVVGAPGSGRAYVYRGGIGSFDASIDATLIGSSADNFGYDVD